MKFDLTFGENDFARRFKDDWDDWARSIPIGINTLTGTRLYDMVVVPEVAGGYVGTATSKIIQGCLINNLPAFLAMFSTNQGSSPTLVELRRIVSVECEDPNDHQTGYKLTTR